VGAILQRVVKSDGLVLDALEHWDWETADPGMIFRVLAAALLRDAGLKADPIYIARERGEFSTRVPGLSRFEHMKLYVAGDNFEAVYDPEDGSFTEGKLPVLGRVVLDRRERSERLRIREREVRGRNRVSGNGYTDHPPEVP